MKSRRVILFSFLTVVFIFLSQNVSFGQNCFFPPCFDNDCGDLNVGFSPLGGPQFCEGQTITLNNTSAAGFDFFVVDWRDGNVDTLYGYEPFQHVYNIPDSLVCTGPPIRPFSLCFKGQKDCDDGISCQSGTYDFGIIVRPEASFSLPFQICVDTEVSISNTSCNANSYLWDFGNGVTSTEANPIISFDEPGFYTILLSASNQCGMDMTSVSIQVVDPPIADFSATTAAEPACVPVVLSLDNQSENSSGHLWSISPSGSALWELADTNLSMNSPNIEVIFYQPGEYTITLNATNACGTDEFIQTIEIFEDINLQIDPPEPYCDEITLTAADLGFSLSGSVESIEWTFVNGSYPSATGGDFPPITFSESGEVMLDILGPCSDTSISFPISIVTGEIIFGNNPEEICLNSPAVQLLAEPPGGQWSGPGIVDGVEGVFDPSGLEAGQSYTLIYSFEISPCEISDEIEIGVLESESGWFDAPVLCEDSEPVALTANPTGGQWSGSGIVDSIIGLFDPEISGTGLFEISYVFLDSNDCEIVLTDELLVEEFPTLQLTDSLQLCLEDFDENLNELTNFSVNPDGGEVIWSGPGVVSSEGSFNSGAGGLVPGFYTIWVDYEWNACSLRESLVIEIVEKPELVVGFADTIICSVSGSFQLEASPEGGVWSGPGVNSQTGLIDLDQAGPGEHTYQYTFLGGSSCELFAEVSVEALDPGLDLVVGDPDEECEGPEVFILSPAEPPGGTWSGPGLVNVVTGEINLSLLSPGQIYEYEYCIESSLIENCTACATRSFVFNSNPVADFSVENFLCVGDPFSPVNNSVGGQMYNWDFGDGNSSTQPNPSHVFNNTGTFTIVLEVISGEGCSHNTSREVTTIEIPVADFELPENEGCEPFDLQLVNLSSGYEPEFIWVIGSDSIFLDDPGNIALFVGDTDSIYTIQLIAMNACGHDQLEQNVRVYPLPLAEFGLSEPSGCSPFEVFFSNTSTGNPELFFWDFGNGNNSNLFNPPSQIYTVDSTYVDYAIELVVENHCGIDTLQREIRVFPPNVTAFIEMPLNQACSPHLFQPVSFSTPGAHLNWELIFDNEVVAGSSERFPEFLLEEAGEYTVVLRATNCGSHTDTTFFRLLDAPDIDFEFRRESCIGDLVTFQNLSTNASSPVWEFGDGNQSNQSSPVHRYEEAGIYQVNLRMLHPATGCPAELGKEIVIHSRPKPDFSVSAEMGCPPLEVTFANRSTGDLPMNYYWNFGDGSFESTLDNPVHAYESSGDYNVRLTATYGDICRDSIVLEKAVKVFLRPMADFEYEAGVNTDILGDVEFFNYSIDADAYLWDFGDGSLSEQENPVHEYDVNRPVTVELIAYNFNNGEFLCTDTTSKPVEPQWITTFFAPSAMSPDYGAIDVRYFKPVGVGMIKYEISIYSPWGEQLWFSNRLDDGSPAEYWDGTFKGVIVPQGAYVWVARMTFLNGVKKVERGTVTVLR
ncbi:MAG: PKD domain-containing protein [Saprospirales bacterium]|nr:MAG: PKD domain-containing protein [Saprospirales bacterium]